MAWILRGLRDGIVTTRYPRHPDDYGPGFRGVISVVPRLAGSGDGGRSGSGDDRTLGDLCPTGAIQTDAVETRGAGPAGDAVVRVDRGRCILCGRCVQARPDRFAFSPAVEPAALARSALVVPTVADDDADLDRLRTELHRRVKALRRSIHIRHVDAGSDGAEEWEVAALMNPVYDVQRLGIFFTATPRHADVLLVTGVGTAGMAGPLRQTFDAMPAPRVVVATGSDAASGGLVHPTYASGPGVGSIVPVDVWVPGSPPSPFSLLHGILLGVGLLPRSGTTP
jgi:Ni,Fe-hydrogenase III small subunit/ferredoxin